MKWFIRLKKKLIQNDYMDYSQSSPARAIILIIGPIIRGVGCNRYRWE